MIIKCDNNTCKLRFTCFRFTTKQKATEWFKGDFDINGQCNYYFPYRIKE